VLDIHAADARGQSDPESVRRQQRQTLIERQVLARGAYCTVGDPDTVAEELARLQAVGFDGLALNFVDYLKELPYFAQEVLPRLERKGLRWPSSPACHPDRSELASGAEGSQTT
jgi:FMNH2-dependent dimethyl sulfone monooxygenase